MQTNKQDGKKARSFAMMAVELNERFKAFSFIDQWMGSNRIAINGFASNDGTIQSFVTVRLRELKDEFEKL